MAERVIHILPERVASQIAAGEVVERPASAVKELVENAIDAGARNVEVMIERGGAGLIEIADDGCGMGRGDALMALRRHATSKIRDAADLVAIRTLGFRGEALAAIASVAHLTLRTRRAVDPDGIELIVKGDETPEVRVCPLAPGTRIVVRDLFFNTPARLKFLKSVATEQAAVVETVQRVALSNPTIAFRLIAEGRTLIDAARAATPVERTRQLFGGRLADRMLPFTAAHDGVRVVGLAAASQESFPSARLLLTFVNGRAVRDRALIRAVTQAYQTLLPRGRYPAVVLFVELAHEAVDVNVHPMKTEVRFRHPGAVFEAVYRTLRTRLADQATTALSPVEASGDAVEASAAPAIAVREALSPAPRERTLRLVADTSAPLAAQAALRLGFGRAAAVADSAAVAPAVPAITAAAPRYAELKVLGQLFTGYIALEGDDGLILIDQHAAHERVTFERLRAEFQTGAIRVQPMLTPATLELDPARAARVAAGLPELRAMGFEVEQFGPATIVLKGAPAIFGAEGGARLLGDMIDAMGDQGFGARGGAFDDCLKTLACHGSVRAGRTLRPPEIAELLTALDATEFKTNCPHGRPVHIEFRRGVIERMFRR